MSIKNKENKLLTTKYNFSEVEANKYDWWVKEGFFEADPTSNKKPFTVVIPPPNVTGSLHLGHAWDNTLQDIIIRRKRMQGYDALYLPGSDHAGIATQARVDAKLRAEGITRHDLGRSKYLEVAWEWKEEYVQIIHSQWKALGLSLDYSKERFTLDDKLNEAVNKVFIDFYNKGYIYRGNRIINWDPELKTALSNIEVEHEDRISKLYYINYPLTDGSGVITIATTRPETMFADQAVMVHPEDERFTNFIGKKVYIPSTNVEILIITDSYVDKDFGTGAVKVTPAHDANDFEVGIRHNLNMPLCMEEDGLMNEMAFKYEGMDRFVCRTNLVKDLEIEGFLVKVEDHNNSIGLSERSGVEVEPRLSLQWFVKMDELAKNTMDNHQVDFIPSRFEKTFNNWMNNIQDWAISRQLWWGHRIPAWYKNDEVKVQIESPGEGWTQDEDVLDTWFSSALWPFSTLGWPNLDDELFKKYYPTNVLVTGYDIIFFWVARMMFQGLEFTNVDPFQEVVLHGLIRDEKGRKMSKSLDNGVDPIDVINKYGVDALRYFLTTNSAPGQDLRYDQTKVESSWNFINKLWNITRYVSINTEGEVREINKEELTIFEIDILNKLNETIEKADQYYERYEFGEASKYLYDFLWEEFANWYVEVAKILLDNVKYQDNTKAVLYYVTTAMLKMLHPFIPFVTEHLYQYLTEEITIVTASWPTIFELPIKEDTATHIYDVITRLRYLKNEYKVSPNRPIDVNLVIKNNKLINEITNHRDIIIQMAKLGDLTITERLSLSDETILLTTNDIDIYVVQGSIIDTQSIIDELLKQKEKLGQELSRSKKMLTNENFIKRAPESKVNEEKAKLANYQQQYDKVVEELAKHV